MGVEDIGVLGEFACDLGLDLAEVRFRPFDRRLEALDLLRHLGGRGERVIGHRDLAPVYMISLADGNTRSDADTAQDLSGSSRWHLTIPHRICSRSIRPWT